MPSVGSLVMKSVMEHCDNKDIEHGDDKGMGYCDDKGHGAL